MKKLEIDDLSLRNIRVFDSGTAAFWALQFHGETQDELQESVTITTPAFFDPAKSLVELWPAARLRLIEKLEEALQVLRSADTLPVPTLPTIPDIELHVETHVERT